MTRKKRTLNGGPGDVLNVNLVVDASDELAGQYVNHAEISHSTHEFVISFCRLPAKPSSARAEEMKSSGVLKVEPLVQVIVPTTFMPALIEALTNNLAAYEKRVGPIPAIPRKAT